MRRCAVSVPPPDRAGTGCWPGASTAPRVTRSGQFGGLARTVRASQFQRVRQPPRSRPSGATSAAPRGKTCARRWPHQGGSRPIRGEQHARRAQRHEMRCTSLCTTPATDGTRPHCPRRHLQQPPRFAAGPSSRRQTVSAQLARGGGPFDQARASASAAQEPGPASRSADQSRVRHVSSHAGARGIRHLGHRPPRSANSRR